MGVSMKKSFVIDSAFALVMIATLVIGLVACKPGLGKVTPLGSTEVKEYQGQDLSSVTDFRENSISGPQHVNIADYKLDITGLVANPTSYSYDEVLKDFSSYSKVVTLNCVEGWSVDILWQGVQVKDILANAKPSPDAKVVIFHAYDGYTTSFPIDYLTSNNILMAYKMNDITMPPERGYPFELVAESKWGYKWIKWVTQIELSDNVSYQGYWESRGYSNSGDLDKSFFDNSNPLNSLTPPY
jgi:DMSO/TMAO reductase YedYZ molybdopterin-dependent catalytic subunit